MWVGYIRGIIRGGVYSYSCVLTVECLSKSVVFKFISKEISRAEHEYMNIHPLPQGLFSCGGDPGNKVGTSTLDSKCPNCHFLGLLSIHSWIISLESWYLQWGLLAV